MRIIFLSRITRRFLFRLIVPGNANVFCRLYGVVTLITYVINFLTIQYSAGSKIAYYFSKHHYISCCFGAPSILTSQWSGLISIPGLSFCASRIDNSDWSLFSYHTTYSTTGFANKTTAITTPAYSEHSAGVENNCLFTAPSTLDRNSGLKSYFEPHGLSV